MKENFFEDLRKKLVEMLKEEYGIDDIIVDAGDDSSIITTTFPASSFITKSKTHNGKTVYIYRFFSYDRVISYIFITSKKFIKREKLENAFEDFILFRCFTREFFGEKICDKCGRKFSFFDTYGKDLHNKVENWLRNYHGCDKKGGER